ncbi:MAG TPA: SUF system Fe-S cluster assembly regulator, partial [Candidatus Angelobacter sp.]|nr:SUF system Fe-S cluster assembly regulator [Candidatus Angelobacter sp.]
MIRLSRLADYGVVLACQMAVKADCCHNAFDLAAATGLPAPTVSKLLAALARAGVLVSQRGAKGGYRLARPPGAITAADIVSAVDGPIALTVCIEHGAGACDVESLCPTRSGWRRINDAVRNAMKSVSLAELAFPVPAGLSDRPAPSPADTLTAG